MSSIQFQSGRHFGVKASGDPERAAEYYQKIGFAVEEKHEGEMVLSCGDQKFSLDFKPEGNNFFDFVVDNIEVTKEFLLSNGATILLEPAPKMLFIKDKFGMQFRLTEA